MNASDIASSLTHEDSDQTVQEDMMALLALMIGINQV
jgi:hypothetical protein